MCANSELSDLLTRQVNDYAIVLLNPDATILSCNDVASRLFGVDPGGCTGRPVADLYAPEDREIIVDELRRSAEGAHVSARRQLKPNANPVWVEESTTALRREDGTLCGFGRITRDASEQHRLQDLVARVNEELHQFAFTVSHDLQEPLRTVRSYSELLARRSKDELSTDAIEFIDYILDAGARMSQLLKDLLAYSQAGRPDRTHPEETNSEAVLQWAIMNLSKEIEAAGAKITHRDLPAVYVDQSQLTLVFQHLISNSLKFRSQEPPVIDVSARPLPGDMWEFSVRDNGVGVDPQYAERIFGVFKRLVGKDVPGTGIGLAICRKIIEAHRGKMWIESEAGKGSVIKFTLPAHE